LCSTNEKGDVTGDLIKIVYIKIVYEVLGYFVSARISAIFKTEVI
jgi:hypothetical protein